MNFLIGHLMGDFLLQTGWMARQKKTRWAPLLAHALVYALAIRLATGWGLAFVARFGIGVLMIILWIIWDLAG